MTTLRLPREASVIPMRDNIFKDARKIALSAGSDWPLLLRAAETLSQSPDWTDVSLGRHIREAYSLHLAGLLKPAEETPADVFMSFRDRWDQIIVWGFVVAVAVWVGLGGLG